MRVLGSAQRPPATRLEREEKVLVEEWALQQDLYNIHQQEDGS